MGVYVYNLLLNKIGIDERDAIIVKKNTELISKIICCLFV